MTFNSKELDTSKIIDLMLARRGVSVTRLAEMLGTSSQNIGKKNPQRKYARKRSYRYFRRAGL